MAFHQHHRKRSLFDFLDHHIWMSVWQFPRYSNMAYYQHHNKRTLFDCLGHHIGRSRLQSHTYLNTACHQYHIQMFQFYSRDHHIWMSIWQFPRYSNMAYHQHHKKKTLFDSRDHHIWLSILHTCLYSSTARLLYCSTIALWYYHDYHKKHKKLPTFSHLKSAHPVNQIYVRSKYYPSDHIYNDGLKHRSCYNDKFRLYPNNEWPHDGPKSRARMPYPTPQNCRQLHCC